MIVGKLCNMVNNLYNGDCLEVIKELSDNSVDLCISSPPYNLDVKYNTYIDKRLDYIDWQIEVWNLVCQKLKNTGQLFLNLQAIRKNYFMPFQIVSNLDWKVQNIFIWNKSELIDGYVRGQAHSMKSKKYIPNGWEYVFHITKNGDTEINWETSKVPYQPKWAKQNYKRFGYTHRPTVNTWFIPYETVSKNGIALKGNKKHPAVFPRQLVEQCIKVSSIKSGTILDNFMGTGTTGIVAQDNNFDFIGIEVDNDYFKFAQERIGQKVIQ
jgi:site-specific DNA-methyltransferase (adenine-specific)